MISFLGLCKTERQAILIKQIESQGLRDRQQKTFTFFSRLCLLRGGGGQDKSTKNG